MDNLKIYNLVRSVPNEAKKPIVGGRLKGMTDVNPIYRIKTLTELFGPCGFGWRYTITDKRLEQYEPTGEVAAFVDINLFVKLDGEWSEAIPGTGGSMFAAKEKTGPYVSDECYKMALTDAISVACKSLGVAADVYWQADRTKYTTGEPEQAPPAAAKSPAPQNEPKVPPKEEHPMYQCAVCGKPIGGVKTKDGGIISAYQQAAQTTKLYGKALCLSHAREAADELKRAEAEQQRMESLQQAYIEGAARSGVK